MGQGGLYLEGPLAQRRGTTQQKVEFLSQEKLVIVRIEILLCTINALPKIIAFNISVYWFRDGEALMVSR